MKISQKNQIQFFCFFLLVKNKYTTAQIRTNAQHFVVMIAESKKNKPFFDLAS